MFTHNISSIVRTGLVLCATIVCFGCSTASKTMGPVPQLTPPAMVVEDNRVSPDSLFDPGGAEYLFSDNRARRVGDIVLVNIVETSKANSEATTELEKESSTELGVEAFFGQSSMAAVPLGVIGDSFGLNVPDIGPSGAVGTSPMVKASSKNDFAGDGETTRESSVTATVASRVVRRLPNGLLQVEGAKEVRVNGETQILVVRGLIRSRDIGPDNAINSNYLADAKIEYYGQGIIADKQRPGWLARILDNVWPF